MRGMIWPGNIRELENVVERTVIMVRGDFITPEELPSGIHTIDPENNGTGIEFSKGKTLKEMEKAMILRTLEDTGGNRTRAAEILGISRRILQMKLKEYGVS